MGGFDEAVPSGWRLPLPTMDERIPENVLFLYESKDDAESGMGFGGSGFLVGLPADLWEGSSAWVWAVTNKHVVRGINGRGASPVIRRVDRSGNPQALPGVVADWVTADDEDLAARPMWPIWENDPDPPMPYVMLDRFVTREDFVRGNPHKPKEYPEPYINPWSIGDETAMFGRYIGLQEEVRNDPTGRFGNIATPGEVPVDHDDNTSGIQNSVLVDGRSLPGYSGSPVYVFRPITGWFRALPIESPSLLGVDWGHLYRLHGHERTFADWSNTAASAFNAMSSNQRAPYSAGLMAVVPAWRLREFLLSDKVQEEQRKAEEALAKKRERAQKDSAIRPDDAYTRDDFMRDLTKVTEREEQTDPGE